MLMIVLRVLILLTAVNCCFGNIILEEDFSSPISNDPSNAKINTGSLDFRFHQEAGNRLWVKDYDAGVRFDLDPTIDDANVTPVLYISFCLRSLNISSKDKFAGVVFYDGDKEMFGMGNDYGSENFAFWTPDGSTFQIGDTRTAVDEEVHKIVCRIAFHADGPEDIAVGIDPFCNRSESRQPKTIWTTCQAELSFDQIRIRCGHNDCNWEFDELRLGTDWASVMPVDDKLGVDYQCFIDNSMAQGQSELIFDNVGRFWPDGIGSSDVLPSLALHMPRQKIGELPQDWNMKPYYGTHDGKKYVFIDIPAETDLYGTGEVVGGLLRNGSKIRLFNKDNGAYGDERGLYQSHPWVIGLRPDGTAFGVIFDTTWIAELNLRAGILFTVTDNAPWFPTIVIEGQNPQELMIKLAQLTGSMPMPPRWALGYQQCRYSYFPDSRAREIADTFRSKQIPCDVIWFDIDYMDGFRVFTFDQQRYPDPKATNDYLHSKGFKGVWMIDPGVKYESGYSVYDSGNAIDAWVKDASGNPFVGPVWPGDCVFPDFTSPEVRNWWAGLYKSFMGQNIDGVWNDMNEPAVFGGDEMTMPMDNKFRGGGILLPGTHQQYHNVYGMLMTKASRDGIMAANPDKRPFLLTRSNYLGGHRFAATWTGDNNATWQHLKWSIPMSLNLSLSGQPFNGPDIGGFLNDATPDLWGHWIAVGAFYPFSRAHTCAGTADQEPWEFGQEVEDAARIALQKRYRLMPYLYTSFRQAHEDGMPVMQPMFFADPDDISLRMEDRAFLLGPDLMVVPQWADDIAFPQDIWQKVTIAGNDITNDQYQCDLKIRGGAVVPLGPIIQSTDEIPLKQELTLVVVLDKNGRASGTLYEDAGDGYDYKLGQYCISEFNAVRSGDTVIVKCNKQDGSLAFDSRNVAVTVVDEIGVYHGYGDIIDAKGVTVILDQPSVWSNQDIGDVSNVGSFSGNGDIFTVTGSGEDIESGTDEFHYVYKHLKGNFELIARVINQQNSNDWAKAGVMIRKELSSHSSHAMSVVTPGNGVAFQRRLVTGDSHTLHSGIGGVTSPQWLRIVRDGDSFEGCYSPDGVNWNLIGSDTISMGEQVYVGLAVTSHNDKALCTVNFDNIKYTLDVCSIDSNSDGTVNLLDFSNISSEWLNNENPDLGDIDGDGFVNLDDILQMLNGWLEVCVN